MSLLKMGWSDFFESEDLDKTSVARVTAVHRSHLVAMTEKKQVNLYLSGQTDTNIAVGDWVTITPEFIDEQDHPGAIIKNRLERKSKISRATPQGEQVIAANVDKVFIVTSANQDFKINRLHRFLILIKEGGAQPIIVLSKVDLDRDHALKVTELKSRLGVDVIPTSTVDGTGVEQILEFMKEGSTSIFVGSSGVGKSSLVNALIGQELQSTNEIREDDHKGRHTTTSRQLFSIPTGGLIIDSPGVREVQVFGSEESIGEVFPIIEELASKCRFSDCQHSTEPECAVIAALNSGELNPEDWANYQKLLKEIAYSNRRIDKAEMSNSKKRWKEINTNMRKRRKFDEGN